MPKLQNQTPNSKDIPNVFWSYSKGPSCSLLLTITSSWPGCAASVLEESGGQRLARVHHGCTLTEVSNEAARNADA
jgi:hypothetical protein